MFIINQYQVLKCGDWQTILFLFLYKLNLEVLSCQLNQTNSAVMDEVFFII